MLLFLSCHSLDSSIKSADYIPDTIIIGDITIRNFTYDPFYTKNFKDLLAYEFYKMDYEVIKSDAPYEEFDNSTIRNKKALFLNITIFQYSYVNLLDEEFNTTIALEVYNNKKQLNMKMVYNANESLEDLSEMKKAAHNIVKNVDKKHKKHYEETHSTD